MSLTLANFEFSNSTHFPSLRSPPSLPVIENVLFVEKAVVLFDCCVSEFSLIIIDDHPSSSYASVHGAYCSCHQETVAFNPPTMETSVSSSTGNSRHQHPRTRQADTRRGHSRLLAQHRRRRFECLYLRLDISYNRKVTALIGQMHVPFSTSSYLVMKCFITNLYYHRVWCLTDVCD